jgi:predicted Zn finger-like uncharacterized protein
MLLTCPKCSARFSVPNEAIGSAGRNVRCGACGQSWHQAPEGAPASPAPTPISPAASAPGYTAPDTPPLTLSPSAPREERLREVPRQGRGWRAGIWLLLLLLLAAIVYGAYRYRDEIVALWPPAGRAYEAVGLKTGTPAGAGLRITPETIRFQQESQSGVPSLMVSGQIVNGSDRPTQLVPLRVMLLGKERNVLRTEAVKLEDRTLKPGEKFDFSARILNPPAEVQAVQIRFAAADK